MKNEVLKKTEYDELVKNVKTSETSHISDLVKIADYNKKIGEIENKIFDHDHSKDITIQRQIRFRKK